MTVTSRPWAGTTLGDAGPYSDDDWAEIFEAFFDSTGDAGILPNYSSGLVVAASSPAAASVSVSAGAGIIRGRFIKSDASATVSITANASGNDRYDIIVLEANYVTQTAQITVVEGTPAASPAEPSLTQSTASIYQIPLARISVTNGFTTIVAADIQDRRQWLNARNNQIQKVNNNTANLLENGTSVSWSASVTSDLPDVDPSITATAEEFAGIVMGKIAGSSTGKIITSGFVPRVITTGAIAAGDLLIISGTSGKLATWNGSGSETVVGRALTADAGGTNGYVSAFIGPFISNVPTIDAEISTTSAGTTSTSFVTVKTFTKTFSFTPSRVTALITCQAVGQDVTQTLHHQITQSAGGGTFTAQVSSMLCGTGNPGHGVPLEFEVDAPTGATITVNLQHRTSSGSWSVTTSNICIDWKAIP